MAGAMFGLGLLAFDVAGLGGLVAGSPLTLVVFLIGAIFAFEPVVLCSIFAALGEGEDD
jgi:hypothetical protein